MLPYTRHSMPEEEKARGRAKTVLLALGLDDPRQLECVMVLMDDMTPSPFTALASAGLKFSSGATTRQIFDEISLRLRLRSIDREMRDYIQLPLREVGILRKGYADSTSGSVILDRWVPKSSSNVYVVDPDFRGMLELKSDTESSEALDAWIRNRDERVARIHSAEARSASGDVTRLVPATLEMYCPWYLPDYEVVFVDDSDGQRIAAKWREGVDRLGLPLDLESRWPDIVLNMPGTNRCWIVDCVETDGEVDPVRRKEIAEHFAERSLVLDGFTTVYRTMRRFTERQQVMDNIAPYTFVWVMETGGAQWLRLPPPEGEEES